MFGHLRKNCACKQSSSSQQGINTVGGNVEPSVNYCDLQILQCVVTVRYNVIPSIQFIANTCILYIYCILDYIENMAVVSGGAFSYFNASV